MVAVRAQRSSYSGRKTDARPSSTSLSDYTPQPMRSASDCSSNRSHEVYPTSHSSSGGTPIPLSDPKCLSEYPSFHSLLTTRKTNSQPTTVPPHTLLISQIALVWRLYSLVAPCGRGARGNLLWMCRGRRRLRTLGKGGC